VSAPLRAFLIDDEPLAIKRLTRLLTATGRVEIVGTATDPAQGLKQIGTDPVDVLFLDIQMPGLSGFDVVERLPRGPMVVFTTAHDRHAVQAFEANAVDSLLMPIERDRLDRTLDRVAARRESPADEDARAALTRLLQSFGVPNTLDHLASRVGDRVQLIPVDQVTHVVARQRATYAVTATAEHMLDATLTDLERKLPATRFIRIHRGMLVNVAWVSELRTDELGHLIVRLKGDTRTQLVVSRDRVRALKERLGLV
jgi:two-component system LytT family response regulator